MNQIKIVIKAIKNLTGIQNRIYQTIIKIVNQIKINLIIIINKEILTIKLVKMLNQWK